MKALFVSLLLAASAFGQSSLEPTTRTSPMRTLDALSDPSAKYLVEFTTHERCYECGTRYLMVCTGADPDCNVPWKDVSHFEEFATIKEALTFVNNGLVRPNTMWTGGWGTTRPNRTFKRLISYTEVPLDKDVTAMDEPQPPVHKEVVKYRYGNERGEEPPPLANLTVTGTGTTSTFIAPNATTGTIGVGTGLCPVIDAEGNVSGSPCDSPQLGHGQKDKKGPRKK